MTQPTLFFGGAISPDLAARVAAGAHPRADYLHFLDAHGAGLRSFGDLPTAHSPFWGLAALARREGAAGPILTTGEDVGLPLALVQRLTGGPRSVFIITHGSYLGSRKFAHALHLLRAAPGITFLCLSESLRRRLIDRHRLPPAQAVNVGYGVDTDFFRPPGLPPEPGLVASAGMANRDYRTLAAAADGLDVSVRVAADSAWYRADLDIAGQALPANVEARSCGDYVGLRALYARAAFVVVPLYPAVHACGYAVIAEAMAMGRAVVATRTESPSDYIVEGETGFYVPPNDPAALRERVEFLLARPGLAAEMGLAARRRMESQFSLEAYNARIAAAMALRCPEARPSVLPADGVGGACAS